MLSILLDDNRTGAGAVFFDAPMATVRADHPGEVEPALDALRGAQARGLYCAGFMSFELGYVMEARLRPLLPPDRDMPLLLFGIYETAKPIPPHEVERWLDERSGHSGYELGDLRPAMSAATYRRKFDRVLDYIAAGDIYQVNLTFKAHGRLAGSPAALYRDLRRKQHVQYGAYIEGQDFTLLSLSPELFIEVRDGKILTRPMKGTARRGLTAQEDDGLAAFLAADKKSRAENLMIVDLMRNDLSRIAEPGSVTVPDLYTVEPYDTVLQMTSGVEARLPEAVDFKRLMQALYPPGSVTGAPKVRAVEIIRELESEPRGVYTGAIGMLEPGDGCRFNVAIRTLRIARDGRMEIGIGSGVVQDSRAQSEYDECLLKMRFLTDPVLEFDLIETLRFDRQGGYVLLDHHLARLEASARRLGFAFERAAVGAALNQHAASLTSPHARVRLNLSRSGRTHITSKPIELPAQGATIRVALAQTRLDPSNLFLYHKTTHRAFYDDERVRLAAITGCDEVVFLNTRGELTEGSFMNLFVEMRGAMLTPPITSGLLAGTLRQQMLADGSAREAVLTLQDLRRADTVWLGNSVRGLLRAEFVESLPPLRAPAEAEVVSSP